MPGALSPTPCALRLTGSKMSKTIRLSPSLSDADVESLKIGDRVLITGAIYTGRDAAHKRLTDLVQAGKTLPIDIQGQII